MELLRTETWKTLKRWGGRALLAGMVFYLGYGLGLWTAAGPRTGSYGAAALTVHTPRGAVEALWEAEDQWLAENLKSPAAETYFSVLSAGAQSGALERPRPYSRRHIVAEERMDDRRWRIGATLILSPPYRSDPEKPSTACAYVVVKEGGQWRVAQARGECVHCAGKGKVGCAECAKTGKTRDGPCAACDATGEAACGGCGGAGWLDLLCPMRLILPLAARPEASGEAATKM